MLLNISYGEEGNVVDRVFVPDSVKLSVEQLESQFFDWLFNKSNNHRYWVYVDGEKAYCSYTSEAFITWINDSIIKEGSERAKLLEAQVEADDNLETETLEF